MADLLLYMAEKYGVAVHMMATREGTLRERVYDAWIKSARLGSPDLGGGHIDTQPSPELARRMRDLAVTAGYDGTYDTSFGWMSDDQIKEFAEEIYVIDHSIQGELFEIRLARELRRRDESGEDR
jgi:hypothetical protein